MSAEAEVYVKNAKERISRGAKEILPPSEDPRLTQMKQEYVEKKTHIVTANSVYSCGSCDKKFKT